MKKLSRKFSKKVLVLLLLLSFSFSTACKQAEARDLSKYKKPNAPKEVGVHDPSVMRDKDGVYYIIGSHLASAKSKDLINWQQISTSVSLVNPLIPDVFTELKESFEWAKSRTLWASDWIYLEGTGKYHMYYCACEGTSPRSTLGMATADAPEGPYKDEGILLKSGMWNEEAPDGEIYDPVIHPNAIDPHVFYDNEGKLWMVYGSYSGGIFILELDPATGLLKEGQGYGKKLLGHGHSQIEAPYILYHPKYKKYYLFLSFGGLASDCGYQIRVSRSDNPDGPYEDIAGKDMIDTKGSNTATAFFGEKLFGNFSWPISKGEFNNGYVSPGHNSAFYDDESGRTFLIFHSRFPGKAEAHQVRVHELFFTDEGWPVVAPFRYLGDELDAMATVNSADIDGEWWFVNHGRKITKEVTATEIVNIENGKIKEFSDAKLNFDKDNKLSLSLDGQEFKGYLVWQYNNAINEYCLTFTAVSNDGTCIWGVKQYE